MCTYTQLHQVTNQMAQCYHDIYGADIVEYFYMVLMPEEIMTISRILI